MAKERKAQQPNVPTSQHPEKTRVTGYLNSVESALFSSICNLFGVNAGDGLATMVWTTFNSLEKGQREAVGAMARAKTGLSRLPSGPKLVESSATEAGQGGSPGLPATEPALATLASVQPVLADGVDQRTSAITARYQQTTAPQDVALHLLAGGD